MRPSAREPRLSTPRPPPPPQRRRHWALFAAAGIAGVGVPAILIRQVSGNGCTTRGTHEDGAALHALALVARRNADALRELVAESRASASDTSVMQAIEHALHGRSGGSSGSSGSTSSSLSSSSSSSRSSFSSSSSSSSRSSVGSSSSSSSDGDRQIWLRFALVSVGRNGNTDYLMRALHSIFEQLPADPRHPLRASTDVVVVNNHEPAEAHEVFHRAARLHSDRARFIPKATLHPPLQCPGLRRGGGPKPQVQRQTCDLVAAFRALIEVQPVAAHILLLEDDWLLCPNGMAAIQHAVDKAYRYDPRWLALRVSYGFNGVLLPTADLPSLTEHLAAHFLRRPPDHLLFEWFSGERKDTRYVYSGITTPRKAAQARTRGPTRTTWQGWHNQTNFNIPRVP